MPNSAHRLNPLLRVSAGRDCKAFGLKEGARDPQMVVSVAQWLMHSPGKDETRDLFQRCLSKTTVAVVIAVNIALLTQWAAAVHVAFYPTSEFIAANAHMVDMWTGLISSECAQLGYSRKV
ncbi:unnamed protein product [Nippostrongylus brasiliensis]|uniref:Transmembrane protein n=1 Tax=Nippostrongylus brasiliensis TaxID=27835 RepID=A0A0N4XXS7_NIPBR|nr:unnamed protein product [Nippostrongylus brasiliensis]